MEPPEGGWMFIGLFYLGTTAGSILKSPLIAAQAITGDDVGMLRV